MKDRKPAKPTEIYGSPEARLDPRATRHFGTNEVDLAQNPLTTGEVPKPSQETAFPSVVHRDANQHFEDLAQAAFPEEPRPRVPPKYVQREIAAAIQEAMGRRGAPGTVRIEGNTVHVASGEFELSCSLGSLAQTWSRMSEAERLTQSTRLAQAISQSQPYRPSTDPRLPFTMDGRVVAVGILAVLVGLYYLTFGRTTELGPAEPRSSRGLSDETRGPGSGLSNGTDRDAQACANTMSRVFRGGSVTVADAAGWIVELALLRQGGPQLLSEDAALRRYLEHPQNPQGSRFIWEGEPNFAPLATSDTLVRVRPLMLDDPSRELSGVALAFSGTLVDPYFNESGRSKYYHIAHTLAKDLNADHAALYARCVGHESHALGSWFRGKNAGGAAASLVYFMGVFASPRHIDTAALPLLESGAVHHPQVFTKIANQAQGLDRKALASAIGNEGGMAMGGPQEPVTITFPFKDGNRASRSSRSLARLSGLAP